MLLSRGPNQMDNWTGKRGCIHETPFHFAEYEAVSICRWHLIETHHASLHHALNTKTLIWELNRKAHVIPHAGPCLFTLTIKNTQTKPAALTCVSTCPICQFTSVQRWMLDCQAMNLRRRRSRNLLGRWLFFWIVKLYCKILPKPKL